MKHFHDTNRSSKSPNWLREHAAVLHWLIEPSASIIGPERRQQARILMAFLLILITIGLLTFTLSLFGFFSEPGEPGSVGLKYRWITVVAIFVLTVAYGLSRGKHWLLAAGLIILTVISALFILVIVNPENHHLVYFLVLGGLLSSLFLSARMTAIIFAVILFGLILLPTFDPSFSASNYFHPLIFILSVGGLVVTAANLRQRYLDQIHVQSMLLSESEARLRELSIRDPLTGLFNRRYLTETLTTEMIRADRKSHPIGIIMVDIDNFKQFNDTFGHAAGDEVLVEISNLLHSHIRSSDLTCRYGGEEFVLVLPEATRKITKLRAEQIREDAEHIQVQFEGKPLEAITLSLGVAVFPENGSTPDAILAAADAAMYQAKRKGRDRVVVAD